MRLFLFSLSLLLCAKLHGAAQDDVARLFLTGLPFVTNTLSVSNLSATAPGSSTVGVTNGAAAAAGVIGEFIGAYSTNQNAGTSSQYYDITNIVLTPGDWDVRGYITFARNSATFTPTANFLIGFGTASGNVAPLDGEVEAITAVNSTAATPLTFTFVPMSFYRRLNIPTNMTVYLKGYVSTYTAGTPKQSGKIEARRMR